MVRHFMRQIIRSNKGATAVEYGIICAVIVLVAMIGIVNLGGRNAVVWGNVSNQVNGR
jgi:pilus assembly protein Flp/PilA